MLKIRLDKFVQPNTELSLLKVSEKSEITYPALHDLISGKKQAMRTDNIDRLITALRELTGKTITPNDLLEYTPDKPSKVKK